MLIKLTAKYGMYMGLSLCAYTIFMWLSRLDSTYLHFGQFLDIAIVILPLTVILLAVRSAAAIGRVSIIARFAIVLGIGVVSFVIYTPFLFAYHNYMNPSWYVSVLSLKEQEVSAENVEPAQISAKLREMKEVNDARSGILDAFPSSVVILPILVDLLTWPFSWNRRRADEQPVDDPEV